MDWYYAESGRQIGPIQQESFEALVRSGVVRPDTLVWQQGMQNWQPYGTVAPPQPQPVAVATAVADSSTRFCTECGRPFRQSELIPFGNSFVCVACKEVFAHKLREGVNVGGAVRYAGFWIRFVALLIDGAILGTIGTLLNMVGMLVFFRGLAPRAPGAAVVYSGVFIAYEGALFLINIAIGISYSVYFWTRYGATPGKLALRLKVVTSAGGPISVSLAIGRFFAYYISAFTLGIGYIMAGFDPQKRALHDRICDTRVIHV